MADSALTTEQAQVLVKYAARGEVKAASVGLGSNGYPPGPDMWLMLTTNRTLWVTPAGEERKA